MIAVITDVTERQHAEARSRRERTLLFTLIDNMPDFIYIKDAEARFLVANRTLVRLVGAASPADLIGKTDADFFPPTWPNATSPTTWPSSDRAGR